MTDEYLSQAKIARENVRNLEDVLEAIEGIKLNDWQDRNRYKPCLRFLNMAKRKNGKEVMEATVLLFDGVSIHGTEVPVDKRLLACLKEHYKKRLSEAKTAFDAM